MKHRNAIGIGVVSVDPEFTFFDIQILYANQGTIRRQRIRILVKGQKALTPFPKIRATRDRWIHRHWAVDPEIPKAVVDEAVRIPNHRRHLKRIAVGSVADITVHRQHAPCILHPQIVQPVIKGRWHAIRRTIPRDARVEDDPLRLRRRGIPIRILDDQRASKVTVAKTQGADRHRARRGVDRDLLRVAPKPVGSITVEFHDIIGIQKDRWWHATIPTCGAPARSVGPRRLRLTKIDIVRNPAINGLASTARNDEEEGKCSEQEGPKQNERERR